MTSPYLTAEEAANLLAGINRRGTGDCWPWAGSRYREGYGRISVGGRQVRVTRLLWSALVGEIPDGWFVCHHCDHPECCNPRHLFVAPPSENSRDMARKGRAARPPRGDANLRHRLSDDQVRAIRASYAGNDSFGRVAELARKHGVSESLIRGIVKGRKRRALA